MGIINEYLKKIKEAVYGEEVRSSIHDAIEQCYKDATGHPDSVAATVKEIGEVSKRIDNLIATGTAQSQEVGKTIATTSQGSKTKINFSDSNVIYTSAFDTVKISDSLFARIDEDDGSPLQILKEGLYYLNASVEIKSEESTIPATAYMILLEMTDEQYNKIEPPIRRVIDFPPNPTFTIERQQISYLFKVEKTTNLRFIVSSIADTSDKLAFSIDDIMLTALDWKGKRSADLSELHDLRIGADGTVYGTAGEAVRCQTSGTPKNLIPVSAKKFEALGIMVKVSGHEFSLSGTATDNGTIRLINETTDTLGMITGKTYYVYGFPSGTRVTFLSGENVCGTMVLADTDNTFEVPEKADRLWLEVIVKYKDTLNYINTLKICDREYKTYQEQIDEANAKIEALQAIITKLVTAPTLTADTNGNLQITENEEG